MEHLFSLTEVYKFFRKTKGTKLLVSYCLTHRESHEPESRKLSDFYIGKQWSFRRVQLTEAYYLSPLFSFDQ